ncbi:amidohydrolase family protein [Pseudoprimorskyibacter insulae]|uniref:2-pyrone-4,6-dicarbaxylate hydrolase n=1 Tax=Pseudoprimorskyibacter insulae TaxID=1695997 RepID=A0A2R8B0D9_9RHOB|nr:amidohydrolase family protein [Pseudoprimorskyibacter insulae]SPF81752.1 2-pyrone-4,6-dicarbaxylate hydrolase [Pseudoprimorskyibacter insulae]
MICDCHIHSFAKGITREGASYAPPEQDLADYWADEAQANGITRAVIVQASVDGTDNSAVLQALTAPPKGMETRGVAMISDKTEGLAEMTAAGVRAARIQDSAKLGISQLGQLPALAARVAEFDWHMELNTAPSRFDLVTDALRAMPEGQPLVLDHMGHIDPQSPKDLDALLALMETGRVWVKLAPTRVSALAHRYDDLETPITRLMAAFPERCLWGSDWPHVMTPPPVPRIAPMLDLCQRVLTPAQQGLLFDTNPAQLYRF